ncbi:MAG TPA: amidohydrolase [Thermomicrobiales bacterium]|jgi:aminobenzoyl-glutamate utilization protein B|nr:amidohydrolase [Thermomicrobiales bacterium]
MTATTETPQVGLVEWLEERQSRFVTMANQIWEHPEVALAEYHACQLQIQDLEADGFTITRNVGELPTAFSASYRHGTGGPVIGFLGEYDALPGLSQERDPVQKMLVPDGPGHGCGHNLLGTAALAAAAVTKAWLIATNTPGEVRYYGCPAEETCEGKVFMARSGAFDDLDIALTWHPNSTNSVWAGSSLAVNNIKFQFKGRTAHAAANPETGRSALDAVELMNVGVNYLREHVIDAARIHYVITNGGGAPNVVPDEAEVWYFVRAPERWQVEELTERVRNVARGAALMTETKMTEVFVSGAYNMLTNRVLSDQLMSALDRLGPMEFDEDEIEYAKTISGAFPDELRKGVLRADSLPESLMNEGLSGDVWPIRDADKVLPGSTDVSDVSWIAPTSQVTTACWPLAIPGHSWAITATTGHSIGMKGMVHAAKAMALTATDLYLDPELLGKARAEFEESTAGRPYQCPIPPHVKPRDVPRPA